MTKNREVQTNFKKFDNNYHYLIYNVNFENVLCKSANRAKIKYL